MLEQLFLGGKVCDLHLKILERIDTVCYEGVRAQSHVREKETPGSFQRPCLSLQKRHGQGFSFLGKVGGRVEGTAGSWEKPRVLVPSRLDPSPLPIT